MNSLRNTNILAPILIIPIFFIFGFFYEMFGLRIFAFTILSLGVYVIAMMPFRWALFFLFTYIGLEGFFKVASNYHPIIHVGSDILVIVLSIKVLLKVFFEGLPRIVWPPLTPLFAVHFVWLMIVLFNPYALSVFSSIAGAKIYVSMFLLYFYGFYLVNTVKDVRFFMYPFILVAAIHTLTGLYQGIHGPEGLLAFHPRYAIQLMKYQGLAFRPFGLTNLPGGPAVYMYQVFPFILYILFTYRSVMLRLSLAALLPLSTFLFFLCQVRSALLKMIVASGIFILGLAHIYSRTSYKAFRRVLMMASALTLVLFFAIPRLSNYAIEAQTSNDVAIERSLSLFEYEKVSKARRGTMERFLTYAKDVPFGAGFARVGASAGAFKQLNKQDKFFGSKHFFSDNFWLSALIEIGIPGMLFITFLVLAILWKGIRHYLDSKDDEVKILTLAILSSLIALTIGLYGAEGLIYNPEACFFWFFSGVLMKLPSLESNRKKQAELVVTHN